MRFFLSLIVMPSLVLLPACSRNERAAPTQDEETKRDHAALQGDWTIVAAESNGEPPPPGLLDQAKLAFSGEKANLMGKESRFELDASKSPRQIDFILGKSRQWGIYELDGDDLKLCVCVKPPEDRPKEFTTKPRTDHTLFIMKRKK
jgi:uncharacterized protein (TIGR03067 family)